MATQPLFPNPDLPQRPESDALAVARLAQRRRLAAAAMVGGAAAVTAGAFIGARALARRNGASEGKPVSQVLANAITACEAAAACRQEAGVGTQRSDVGAGEPQAHSS